MPATCFGILEDDHGEFWIVPKWAFPDRSGDRAVKNFSVADGLQSNQFKAHSCYKSRSGALYFGGVNGFNTFYPDSIRENPFDPPLLITGLSIFNKQVPIGDSAHPLR